MSSFKTFLAAVQPLIDLGLPILLRAKHGVGKSMLVYQLAAKMKLPVIERRASQMTEGDLLGLPKIDGDSTTWLPPAWLYQACQEPVVLFFDELDRGILEVRQGLFELADSRKIAGHTLHKDTKIFAAINGGVHGAQYSVNMMDPAELDRWSAFDLEPTTEDWLEWARTAGIDRIVCDFIAENPKHLEHTTDFEPGKVYPSRRSWHRLSDAVKGRDFLIPKKPNPLLQPLAAAIVGLEASIAIMDYARKMEADVSAEDILNSFDKVEDRVKEFSNVDHNAMIEKLKNYEPFNKKWSKKHLKNIGKYLKYVPAEIFAPLCMGDVISHENITQLCDDSTDWKEKIINTVAVTMEEKEKEEK